MNIENCFSYSRDSLGKAVDNYVQYMGELKMEIESLPENTHHDYLLQLVYGIDEAYLELVNHVITCGIQGTSNEIALKHEIRRAEYSSRNAISTLGDCILNGIVKKHSCWNAWQKVARGTLRTHAPENYRELQKAEGER